MAKVGVGKPIVQSAVLEQPPEALARQLLAYGNSAQAYRAVQSGPGELHFTRTFWPVWYVVVAVVGFFLCLIGPLILLANQTEMLSIRLQPGPRPGTTQITVSGVADPEMMGWLMALLGQGQFVDMAGLVNELGPTSASVSMSPDGAYWWDGAAWQDASLSAPPEAPRSPDRAFWWDGGRWRPVPTDVGPGAASASSNAAPPSDSPV